MKNWMLGAAVLAGVLGAGAATAQAAEFGVVVRGPVAYVPPRPGPGYVWAPGYYANGYWVAGRWNFGGGRVADRGYFGRFDGDRGDRHFDQNRGRFADHDRFHR